MSKKPIFESDPMDLETLLTALLAIAEKHGGRVKTNITDVSRVSTPTNEVPKITLYNEFDQPDS
jgi:phytoene dehydrogenase-like protein